MYNICCSVLFDQEQTEPSRGLKVAQTVSAHSDAELGPTAILSAVQPPLPSLKPQCITSHTTPFARPA